jgi:hypothetical protein
MSEKCNWCSGTRDKHSMLCPLYPEFGYDENWVPYTESQWPRHCREVGAKLANKYNDAVTAEFVRLLAIGSPAVNSAEFVNGERYTLEQVGDLRHEFLEAMQYGSAGETDWESFTKWVSAKNQLQPSVVMLPPGAAEAGVTLETVRRLYE